MLFCLCISMFVQHSQNYQCIQIKINMRSVLSTEIQSSLCALFHRDYYMWYGTRKPHCITCTCWYNESNVLNNSRISNCTYI